VTDNNQALQGSKAPNFEEIYNELVDEGVWLEEQVRQQQGAYDGCPLCQEAATVLSTLADFLGARLQIADQGVDGCEDPAQLPSVKVFYAATLSHDKAWYDMTKACVMALFEAGHNPDVLKSHPDMKPKSRPGATKAQLNKNQRKAKRKAERTARKRARARA
jgi:hypothetical protein